MDTSRDSAVEYCSVSSLSQLANLRVFYTGLKSWHCKMNEALNTSWHGCENHNLKALVCFEEAGIVQVSFIIQVTWIWGTGFVSGGWGSCYAIGGCGEGRRERLVWCSEADGRTVLEVMCDPQSEPPTSKPCFTACRHHRGKYIPWWNCLICFGYLIALMPMPVAVLSKA